MNRTVESERMLMKSISISSNFTLAYVELVRLKGPNDRNIAQLLKKLVGLSSDPDYAIMYAQWLQKRGELFYFTFFVLPTSKYNLYFKFYLINFCIL